MSLQLASKISSQDTKLGLIEKDPKKTSFWNGRNVSIAIAGAVALVAIFAYLYYEGSQSNSGLKNYVSIFDTDCYSNAPELKDSYRGSVHMNSDNKPRCLRSVKDIVCKEAILKICKEKNISCENFNFRNSAIFSSNKVISCHVNFPKTLSNFFQVDFFPARLVQFTHGYTNNSWIGHPLLANYTSKPWFLKERISMEMALFFK